MKVLCKQTSVIIYDSSPMDIYGHAKKVSRIKHFYWIQPICLPYMGTVYRKRHLVGITSNDLLLL